MPKKHKLGFRLCAATLLAWCSLLGPRASAGTSYIFINLYTTGHPTGITDTFINGVASGGTVVGGGNTIGGLRHAVLWTPANPVGIDLDPALFGGPSNSGSEV